MGERPPIQPRFEIDELLPRSLLEAVPCGVVAVRDDGAIVSANAEALEFLGLRLDELTQRYVAGFRSESLREDGSPMPPAEYPVSRALQTGTPQGPNIVGVRRPDGRTRWGVFRGTPLRDEQGTLRGAYVTIVDITARRESEERVKNSEHRWRTLAESVADFVVLIDREFKFRWINRALPHLSIEGLIGQSLLDYVQPGSRDDAEHNLRRVLADGEIRTWEGYGVGPGGRTSIYESRAAPIRENGEITSIVVITRDLTEMFALRAQVARSERLASLGLVAAGVAHEINNPLTYIKTNLAFVARRLGSDPEIAEAMADAQAGVDRIAVVVRDLQVFSTAADDPREPVDVVATADAVLALVRNEIRHRARIVRDYGSVAPVEASPARLGQVLLNLLVNAAHAIEVGDAENNEVRIRVRMHDPNTVEIAVSDTGRGIAPEDLDRVFEPFFTTKPLGSGVGLGLSICHDYVTRLGGSIDVHSSVGKGSTFTVRLCSARARASDPAPAITAQAEPRGLRVLVVDDDRAVAGALARMLRADDHQVDIVHDAASALARLDDAHYDAIVCDVMMPDQSGPQLHTRVRARDPQLAERFIFITGGAFGESTRAALDALTNPVIAKPVDERTLRDALARVTVHHP